MKHLVLYTMEGCHFCGQFKEILKCENIEFMDRDINQHNEEYELFRSVKNDLVPAFMIVDDENPTLSELFAPDIDFPTLEEAVKIIKERI
jgi:glutaredoxin